MTDRPPELRSISYGGGVQSTALLVLAAQGRIDFRLFLMANVGDDSENPATLRYLDEYARPFAAEHGIELVVLDRVKRDGSVETLMQRLERPGSRSIPIPVRMANGAPGNRSCTPDFKIKVIGKELKRRGATPAAPATIGIGISVDEIHRAGNRRTEPHEIVTYPLLDLGLRRTDCARIIREAGLPVPPKSSCWFCPMKRPEDWQSLRREEPELFAKSAQLEALLNERRATLTDRNGNAKDPVYLTRFNRPLREAIPDGVDLLPMFDEADGACDSGYCFT
ncbi:phosphoadenosine phosphosulfate reductase [Streptomyces bauhiniae]|uniref:Phosphoadenosine phosphosulfate reductase n=1 Tax=Streptomyces bauhiniae TaxID=2340725 RepID=A0A7K3QRC0_9ACTN|nr:phosphoadenosine phosphosulfate reductase [Streptomyces bauhiniae]NEB92412.1 phosphoadenosine phosphosulfate reductase [Streptomyces bauhiniae]